MPARSALVVLTSLALAASLTAQWSSDPALNVALAAGASDQTQPKAVPAPADGTWLSWFDGIGTGFDVRVQRLDGSGAKTLGAAGVLVADRNFSSTQDYGLAVSGTGDALLAYRDDGAGTQIHASRVAPDGTLRWGPGGVPLTSTAAFVAAPKIADAGDGGAFVAWTQDTDVHVQRLDATGAPVWLADTVLSPASGSYSLSDMHPSNDGVIVSLIREAGGFGSPRHLLAQRVDAAGATSWGAAPITVFDAGSLQFGNFPTFVPDGAGGAVFSWYDTATLQFQCYVQRLFVDGTAAFSANGVPVSTNVTRVRVSPDVAFDASTQEITCAWTEQSGPSLSGVLAQRFDVAGDRLWGSQGLPLLPLGTDAVSLVRVRASGTSSFVFWSAEPAFASATIRGARVTAGGDVDLPAFDVASTPSGKSRLAVSRTTAGDLALAWTDTRVDAGDVYGQNVRCDGALGPVTPGAAWSDLGGGLAGTLAAPTLAGTGTLCPDTPAAIALTGALPNALATLVVGFTELSAPFKGGTLVPKPDLLIAGLPTGPTGAFELPFAWPAPPTSGLSLTWQAWVPDPGGPAGFSASHALRSTAP